MTLNDGKKKKVAILRENCRKVKGFLTSGFKVKLKCMYKERKNGEEGKERVGKKTRVGRGEREREGRKSGRRTFFAVKFSSK